MKKNLRYIIAFLLAIMMLLSLCACAQTGTAGNSGELDLDYVGEDTDQPEEEKPWYSWFTEAFSFGKKETTTTPSQSKPDSVADFYAQGSGDAPQGNKGNKTDRRPLPPRRRIPPTIHPIPAAKRTTIKRTTRRARTATPPRLLPSRSPKARKTPSPLPFAAIQRCITVCIWRASGRASSRPPA